jgi:hypothetical protein
MHIRVTNRWPGGKYNPAVIDGNTVLPGGCAKGLVTFSSGIRKKNARCRYLTIRSRVHSSKSLLPNLHPQGVHYFLGK